MLDSLCRWHTDPIISDHISALVGLWAFVLDLPAISPSHPIILATKKNEAVELGHSEGRRT